MGTIRVLLAFAVIFSHTGSHVLVGGEAALQCFYLISGFLISYILQNTAAYGNLYNFYINRFLRIYPMYWAVALLTVMFYLLAFVLGIDHKLQTLLSLPLSAQMTLMTTNIVLFGQDVIMFLGLRENGLAFFLDYHASSPQLWTFLLVPQAWSLFLFGALAHQILLPRVEQLCDAVPRLETIAVVALLATIVALPMPAGEGYLLKKCFLLLAFALALPFLFQFQKHNRWDRTIGQFELSSLHLPLVRHSSIRKNGLKTVHLELPAAPFSSLSVIAMSLIFSVGLNAYVAAPVDRLAKSGQRQRKTKSGCRAAGRTEEGGVARCVTPSSRGRQAKSSDAT